MGGAQTHRQELDNSVKAFTPAFPHELAAADDRYYTTTPIASPFGNEMAIQVAELVAEREGLGRDDVPDLLAINLACNDYVGHAWGPYSLEAQDITLRTDLLLAELAAFLDRQAGRDAWTLIVTSDHGAGPIPEFAASARLPAVRNPLGDLDEFRRRLEDELVYRLGRPADIAPTVSRLLGAPEPLGCMTEPLGEALGD